MKVKDKTKVKSGCNECSDKDKEAKIKERLERVEKVTSILKGIYPNEKDEQDAILSFCKSAMTIPEIEFIASTMKHEYLAIRDSYIQSQVGKVGVY